MDRILIVDFNGYYCQTDQVSKSLGQNFVIKEFAKCGISKSGKIKILPEPIVTKYDVEIETFNDTHAQIYRDFVYATGIFGSKGTHTISELRNQIIRMLLNNKIIYVETDKKREQLQSFIQKRTNKIKSLSSFDDFNFQQKSSRICSIHHPIENRNVHCAYYRAIALADYANKFYFKLNLYDKNVTYVALVDLNVCCESDNLFSLKELSIKILNSNGKVKYEELFVAKLTDSDIDENYSKYYNKYGILPSAGNYNLVFALTELNSIISEYSASLKVIYVRNKIIKNIFNELLNRPLPSSVKIVCLDEIDYEEPDNVTKKCKYHEDGYLEESGEKCADEHTDKILQWIMEKEYFDYEILRDETLVYFKR